MGKSILVKFSGSIDLGELGLQGFVILNWELDSLPKSGTFDDLRREISRRIMNIVNYGFVHVGVPDKCKVPEMRRLGDLPAVGQTMDHVFGRSLVEDSKASSINKIIGDSGRARFVNYVK